MCFLYCGLHVILCNGLGMKHTLAYELLGTVKPKVVVRLTFPTSNILIFKVFFADRQTDRLTD